VPAGADAVCGRPADRGADTGVLEEHTDKWLPPLGRKVLASQQKSRWREASIHESPRREILGNPENLRVLQRARALTLLPSNSCFVPSSSRYLLLTGSLIGLQSRAHVVANAEPAASANTTVAMRAATVSTKMRPPIIVLTSLRPLVAPVL